MSIVYDKCEYCKVKLSERNYKKHSDKCFLNEVNSSKIIRFLTQAKHDVTSLSKTNYINFDKDLITPKTLMNSLKVNNWNKALIKLYLIYYKYNLIDSIEEIDLMLYIATSGKFVKNYNKLYETIINNELQEFEILINHLNFKNQYVNLYCAIILRALRDLFESNEYDENKLLIDKNDAFLFLKDEFPEILVKLGYNLS